MPSKQQDAPEELVDMGNRLLQVPIADLDVPVQQPVVQAVVDMA